MAGRRERTRIIVVSAIFFLSSVLLSAQSLFGIDTLLFYGIHSPGEPFSSVTRAVDLTSLPMFVLIPGGALAGGGFGNDPDLFATGLLLGVGQAATFGVTVFLKSVIDRRRPFESLSSARPEHLWSALGSSFPSGHSSQSFAIATMLSLRYRKPLLTGGMFFWAGAVAYGRIALGLHYPSDVLAGALLGAGMAILVYQGRSDARNLAGRVLQGKNASVPEYPVAGIRLLAVRIPLN